MTMEEASLLLPCAFDFFLSYPPDELPAAERLHTLLAPHARTFFDRFALEPGKDWTRSILEAQRSARVTVVLIGPSSPRSVYVRWQLRLGLGLEGRNPGQHEVLPVLMGGEAASGLLLEVGLPGKQSLDLLALGGLEGVADALLERCTLAARPVRGREVLAGAAGESSFAGSDSDAEKGDVRRRSSASFLRESWWLRVLVVTLQVLLAAWVVVGIALLALMLS